MTAGRASAPAKIILFGEHFVVYDNPAILASISRRISVTARAGKADRIVIRTDIGSGEFASSGFKPLAGKDAKTILEPLHNAVRRVLSDRKQDIGIEIDVTSDIPHGIGLGSSAASCVATVAAVDSLFCKPDRNWVCERAIGSEQMIHKNSSGADCYVSTFGGLIYYSRAEGFSKIEQPPALWLVIGDTGIKHSTGDLVTKVRKFKEKNESLFGRLAGRADDICRQALAAITAGDRDRIGSLMNENQILLQQVGVSHKRSERVLEICKDAGALGAKITGAGGGGAVIALAKSKKESTKIASDIRVKGYNSFEVEIDCKGLIV